MLLLAADHREGAGAVTFNTCMQSPRTTAAMHLTAVHCAAAGAEFASWRTHDRTALGITGREVPPSAEIRTPPDIGGTAHQLSGKVCPGYAERCIVVSLQQVGPGSVGTVVNDKRHSIAIVQARRMLPVAAMRHRH
jgi:hypothetical protein